MHISAPARCSRRARRVARGQEGGRSAQRSSTAATAHGTAVCSAQTPGHTTAAPPQQEEQEARAHARAWRRGGGVTWWRVVVRGDSGRASERGGSAAWRRRGWWAMGPRTCSSCCSTSRCPASAAVCAGVRPCRSCASASAPCLQAPRVPSGAATLPHLVRTAGHNKGPAQVQMQAPCAPAPQQQANHVLVAALARLRAVRGQSCLLLGGRLQRQASTCTCACLFT